MRGNAAYFFSSAQLDLAPFQGQLGATRTLQCFHADHIGMFKE